ncbi:MAG: isoprenylcysteine carboxylmethyltransferase family protein [Haliscomenobacter sp.]|nr:isoprenylcysteine carboxylmethyltransferase family protein [Haliscomenobacter sp.]MBK8655810.1 isoprenylcysteine carboxylmethyltransferase family protein [Haliscomenobacter sp.]MBP9076676.1 isoprenylcysteine carboxylmethyltransferase family protein [Haliscomenobacter sp.]MBP9872854.1 isoprenylcysteine carboxylmethyltransferase family protein [Haliscomenobacter sp.]
MDPYQITLHSWGKVASVYQDYFMDLDLYNDTYDAFCQAVYKPGARIFEIGCGPGNITRYVLANTLVDSGIFRYLRHPLYASLLYLAWGILLKNPTPELWIVALLVSGFLYLTARADEKECKAFFGQAYSDYMTRSKMFVPFVF